MCCHCHCCQCWELTVWFALGMLVASAVISAAGIFFGGKR
jgi:hypothetical protein